MKKVSAIILFIIQALPIPVSLISNIGTIMAIASIGMFEPAPILNSIVAISTMILTGTYTITYIFSLFHFRKTKILSFKSFLPLIHLAVAILFFCWWSYLDSFTIL